MPVMTANNTLGGNNYAVIGSSTENSSNKIFKSFNGNSSTYGVLNNVNQGYVIFYSPVVIKLTQVLFTSPSAR